MTVTSQENKIFFVGNGVATEFCIPFPFFENTHLSVYQQLNGIQTVRTDWTVSGGNIVFDTAPVPGAQIVIMREVPITQETEYRENDILSAATLERSFDVLTMQVQQLKEKSDRVLTVDLFDDTQASELLPSVRKAVADTAHYADTAAEQAQTAMQAATEAAGQAALAAEKVLEAGELLENKADRDLSNLSADGKEAAITLALPDYSSAVSFSLASEEEWTAPYTCLLIALFSYSNANITGCVDHVPLWTAGSTATSTGNRQWCLIPKGSSFKANVSVSCVCLKLKGVSSNA